MGRIYDVNGLAIALENVAYIDRIKRIKGDNAHDLLAYRLHPDQVIYSMKIHFLGNTKPLALTDEKEEILNKIRAQLVNAIEQKEGEKNHAKKIIN